MAVLVGERIAYRMRRVEERVGGFVVPLDVLASLDEVLEEMCRLEGALGSAEALRLTPYFGALWPSARALARWLVAREDWLAGQRVVELGCGLALPSMIAARLGAQVVATDRHVDAAALLARNAAHAPAVPRYRALDWTDRADVARLVAAVGRPDRILASDILYEADIVDALVPALEILMTPTTRLVISDPGRPHLQAAVERIERAGLFERRGRLEIVAVPAEADDPALAATQREIFVIEFSRDEAGCTTTAADRSRS